MTETRKATVELDMTALPPRDRLRALALVARMGYSVYLGEKDERCDVLGITVPSEEVTLYKEGVEILADWLVDKNK